MGCLCVMRYTLGFGSYYIGQTSLFLHASPVMQSRYLFGYQC